VGSGSIPWMCASVVLGSPDTSIRRAVALSVSDTSVFRELDPDAPTSSAAGSPLNMTTSGWSIAVGVLAAAFLTAPHIAGQQPAPHPQAQIVSAIGSDADAGRVVWRVVSDAFANRGSRHYLLRSQVRGEWLPRIEGTELVLVSGDEATTLAGRCGTYWILDSVRRTNDSVSVNLHRQCAGSGLGYIVSFDGQDWRLGPPGLAPGQGWGPGIGSGFVGDPPPECHCDQ
jgi:hypothetical protein